MRLQDGFCNSCQLEPFCRRHPVQWQCFPPSKHAVCLQSLIIAITQRQLAGVLVNALAPKSLKDSLTLRVALNTVQHGVWWLQGSETG